MGLAFEVEVGRALRRARLARGLTLRDVGARSDGAFSPTAVAGYERAERSISLLRFQQLAEFYGLKPQRMLADILEAVEDTPDVVDLTKVESRSARKDASTRR